METFSMLLALCVGNWPVPGEFSAQRPVTRSFDVFFDLRPNKRLSKQWRGWCYEMPSYSLWRHCNGWLWDCLNFIMLIKFLYWKDTIFILNQPLGPVFQDGWWDLAGASTSFNTLRPRQNGRHFVDTFKLIFVNENVRISIKILMKFVPKAPISTIQALVQIMAWRRPGDKPLSEPMTGSLPTHISVTWPQWVKLSLVIIAQHSHMLFVTE